MNLSSTFCSNQRVTDLFNINSQLQHRLWHTVQKTLNWFWLYLVTSQTFYWRKDRCYRIDIKSSRKDESIVQSGLKKLQQFQTYHWIELMKLRLMDWSTISFFTAIGYKVCELPLLNVRLVISFTCSGNIWKVDSVGFDRWFIQVSWNRDSFIYNSKTL